MVSHTEACLGLVGDPIDDGPRRFSELRTDMPAISAKVLSTRLREMEQNGVVTRTVVPTKPPSVEYALTELGHG